MKKRIGKKAVTQLEVIKDLKVVLVLSEGKIFAHNVKTLVKNVNMIDVKNAALFCVDSKSPYHVCVALKGKKKLQVLLAPLPYLHLSPSAYHHHLSSFAQVFRYLWKEERFELSKV